MTDAGTGRDAREAGIGELVGLFHAGAHRPAADIDEHNLFCPKIQASGQPNGELSGRGKDAFFTKRNQRGGDSKSEIK